MDVTVTLVGELSNADVLAEIEDALKRHPGLNVRGIRVSNSLHQRGIEGEYKGIPIAMSPKLYPEDQIEIVFDDE